MAVPFSNNTMRVPHGFANLLEGLSREVLRHQPEDIPTFAAQYFAELLQRREESGVDPAKWGAVMEQRFNKDDTLSDATNREVCSPIKETSSSVNEGTVSEQDSSANIDDIIIKPTQKSSPSPETLDTFNDIEDPPEPQPDNELNELEEESGETDWEISYGGTAVVDICAEELKNTDPDKEQMLENIQEAASVDVAEETAEKDLDPVTLTSYHDLADIDVCAEKLQSTSQEEEQTESSGDMTMTDAGFIPPSESPDCVLVEQNVLDTHDEFAPSETDTSLYVDQEISDISFNEKTIASPVNEEKLEENGDLSEQVSEMTNTLFDDAWPEIHHVDQLHPNEESESTSVSEGVKTFDDTYPDEMPVEATSESSFILDKVSLEDMIHNSTPGLEDLVNVGSEIQEENYSCESVTEVTVATDEIDYQVDMQEDEPYDEKQGDPQDIPEMIPVKDIEGFVDGNLNPTGILSEDINKDEPRPSQKDVDEVEDINKDDEGNSSVHAPETQDDNLFYSTFSQGSMNTLSVSISDVTDQDMTVKYEQPATPSQERTEEPDPAADIEECEQLDDKVHKPILESENAVVDRQEESSQPQEEEDIMDIPLDDPEANKAAAKIQAGFRGHMTRKKLKPGEKPGEEVSSTGETLNGSQGDAAGGSEGVETDETSVPEQ